MVIKNVIYHGTIRKKTSQKIQIQAKPIVSDAYDDPYISG